MTRLLAAIVTVAVPLALSAQESVDLSKAKLKNPATFNKKAPDTFKVNFDTSKGTFVVTVHRAWAPLGADRFYNLVRGGFYDDCRFFRVIDGFMAQVGINGDPAIQSAWRDATIADDAVKESNKRGFVTFAKTRAPNSRSTQFFINFSDANATLDKQGFAPFGEVAAQGMEIVDKLYSGYGEGAPSGSGPEQAKLQAQGHAYVLKEFPKLDYIKKATIEK
jgi:peptidyl-prolyl cis-trans isomerase A (cyclophilin A)